MTSLDINTGEMSPKDSIENKININDVNDIKKHIFDLLFEKDLLIDAIDEKKQLLLKEQLKKAEFESKLWINTDFKSLKLTNKEMREAYVENEMKDFFDKTGALKNQVKSLEMKYHALEVKINILSSFVLEGVL